MKNILKKIKIVIKDFFFVEKEYTILKSNI